MPLRYACAVFVTCAATALTADAAVGQEKVKPAPGQTCRIVTERLPARQPTPEDSLRRVAQRELRKDIGLLLGEQQPDTGYLVLEVNAVSGRQRFDAVDVTLDDDTEAAVRQRMAEYAERIGRSTFIRVPIEEPAATDTVPLPYETCMPVLRNRPAIDARLQRVRNKLNKQAPPFQTTQLEVVLWLFVSDRGDVLLREIRESSGDRAYDRSIFDAAEGMKFYPALRNGIPRGGWVSLPIITNVKGRPR